MSSFPRAIGLAMEGLRFSFRNHPNIQRQLVIGFLAFACGLFFKLSSIEWAVLAITIAIVLLAEFMNTVIEEVVNLITTEYHKQAKIAKDVAAGMVLLTSMMAIIVGVLLFGPKLLK